VHKIVPYNTGKIKIGIAHQRKPSYFPDADATFLQQALLNTKPIKKFSFKTFLNKFI